MLEFYLEAKDVSNKLKLTPFYIKFKEIKKDEEYTTLCKLEDDEILKTIALGKKEPENITFTCKMENGNNTLNSSDSSEVEITSASDFKGGNITLEFLVDKNISLNLTECQADSDDELLSITQRNLTFRQLSHYQLIDPKKINFLISVFASKTLPENYSIPITISVPVNDSTKNYYALCTLNKLINISENEILPADFNCTIELEEEIDNKTIIEKFESKDMNGINRLNNLKLNETDEMISEGLIEDVSNGTEIPTIFRPEKIITENCEELGMFTIKGKFGQNIEEDGKFETSLLNGIPVTCRYEKSLKDVETEIKCASNLNITESKLFLDANLVFDENEEKFLILPIFSEENNVTCSIGNIYQDLDNKLLLNISFRQVSKYKVDRDSKKINFNFYAITNESLFENNKIQIKVNLINGSDLIESVANCRLPKKIAPENGQFLQADFECAIENLDNPDEFSGLKVVTSDSVLGFPTDSDLLNPAIVDMLISSDLIKDYSLEENKNEKINLFNATSINANDSEKTGKFFIYGMANNFTLNNSKKFEIVLMTGEKAKCTLPKIKDNDTEVKIECTLQKKLDKSRIMIQQCPILDNYNEIITLGKISTQEEFNATNGKEIELNKSYNVDLSFGQLSGFKAKEQFISFNFIGFTTKWLNENDNITMKVNLIKGDDLIEEDVVCKALNKAEPNAGEQVQINFKCIIENVGNPEEYNGLILSSSEDINDIPTEEDLLNPAVVDVLIEQEEVKDYNSEDFKKEELPVFNSTSIDTDDSDKTGKFIINGEFISNFKPKKSFTFEVKLMSGEKALCTLPKITEGGEVKIKCELQEELKNKKIMISQCSALDGYKPMFKLNKIKTKKKNKIPNGKAIKLNKLFEQHLSFRQLNGFLKLNNLISFFFIGYSDQPIKKGDNITMKVNLIKGDDLIEEDAKCSAEHDINPKDGKQVQIKYECKIENIEEATKYSGLVLSSSDAINDIPTEEDLLNPAKVDLLIEQEEVKNFTSDEDIEKELPEFNSTSIDTNDSDKTGKFIIKGKFISNFKPKKSFTFEVKLMSGEKALCTLPKITEDGEVKIECVLQEELKNKKIMISQCSAFNGYKPMFKLHKIETKKQVRIPNGKLYKLHKLFGLNLSFGQLNRFLIQGKNISFFFIGFSGNQIKKGDNLTMKVNLIKGNDLIEEDAKCVAQEINPKNGEQVQIKYECKIENVENPNEYSGLVLSSSDVINDLPTLEDLLNPAKVDELIQKGEVQNYTSTENIEIPEFNSTSIDVSDADKEGKFIIKGNFLPGFNPKKSFKFEVKLMSGEKALCTLPKIKEGGEGEVKIECILQDKLKDSKIMISQCSAFDGYNPIFKLLKIETKKKVRIPNGKVIKMKKLFNINLSFGQLNSFLNLNNTISFFFIGFSGNPIKKDDIINMKVNLIKGDELIEEDAECVAINDIDPKEGKQVQIKFECKIKVSPENYSGLILSSSEEINGIPTDEHLLNPAKVDILIEKGDVKNYTSTENEEIPIFNSTSIDTSESDKTGKFIIKGNFPRDYKSLTKIEFEIVLLSGEKALCTLPKITGKDEEVEIECQLQQELKGTKIMIGHCPAFYKFNPIFNFFKIATIKEIKMPDRNTILDDIFKRSLSFGQLNRFKKEPKLITFFFVGLTGKTIKKYAAINMKVNLIKGNNLLKKNAKCKATKKVEPKNGKLAKVNFECRIENIDNAEEYIGALLIECDDINSIPTEEVLLNPATVDILIQQGEIKNYTPKDEDDDDDDDDNEEEEEEIPVFNSTSIDTTDSDKTGKFIINGNFLSEFNLKKQFEFVLTLMSGEKALCKIPKVSKEREVKIECLLQEEFKKNKIRIGQCSGFNKYNEVIRLSKIISDETITIPNGKLILLNNLFNISLSFGQINKFRKRDKLIEFIFVGLTPKSITKDKSIKILVDLLKDDDSLGEEEAICNVTKEVDPQDGKLELVTFNCTLDNIDDIVNNCTGLEIVSSENISGIPEDPNLKNPVLVEELIISGEIPNYTSPDFEKEEIPVFNSTSIDITGSEKTGIFVINGNLSSDLPINKTFEFELLLMSGEKALCTIPKKSKKGKVKIECLLLNELIDSKIMIEQCSILDGYKEVLRFNKSTLDKEVVLPNGKNIKLDKLFDINLSFGQVSNFLIKDNIISFFFEGFTPEALKKGDNITFVVDLIKDDELVEEEANCSCKNEVNKSEDVFQLVDFECKIENAPNPETFKGLKIISSENVSGIPQENDDLINPVLVDEIIRAGEIKNYSSENNKNQTELIPIFEPKSIDTSECLTNGIFVIIGEPLSNFKLDKELEFEIKLVSGEKAKCTLPEVNSGEKEIKIKCELQEELKDTKIMIEPLTALDGYKEIIRLKKFATDKEVSAANGKEKRFKKKFNRKFSFRQTKNFKFESPKVTFDILAFSSEPIQKDEEFDIDVNLLLTIDSQKGTAKCNPKKNINLPDSKKHAPIAFECHINLDLTEDKNLNCTGIEIEDSDIISNIPKDPKLCNPKKSDKLILLGEMEETNEEEDKIPEFNATLIDTNYSISTGIFYIIGKPLDVIEKDLIFNITLVSGQTALCKLPKSFKDNETKIECELDGTIEKEYIMIPDTTVLKGYKELFKLNKIATKREVSCSNGKLKKKSKLLNKTISFRQISHFNPVDKAISFILSTFVNENMEKGENITLNINLEKEKDKFSPEKVVCKLNEEVKISSENIPVPSNFECTLENIDNATNAVGLEITSCNEISGIPSDPNMTNPAEVDKLIEKGQIVDLTIEENKKKLPPLFTPKSINSLGCRGTGTFKVIGKFDQKIDHFRFNLPLSYPEINTRCDVPDAKEGEDVEITCKTRSPFSSSKIIIEQSTINKNNSEVVSLLPVSSENEITCEDFSKIYSRKMIKKFKAPFSFRQTRKFSNNKGKITFLVIVLKTDSYNNETSITIKINVNLESTLRNLEENTITIEVQCPINSTENNKAEFKCEINGQPNANGVVVLDSDDISGIPENQELTNPAKVDDLIRNGTLKDDDSTLPYVNGGKINDDDCGEEGTININDLTINESVNNGSVFILKYSPESYGDCQIEIEKKKIECYNKEEIESDKIIIPETVVRDSENNTDLFVLNKLVSDSDDITCAINNNVHYKNSEPEKSDENNESEEFNSDTVNIPSTTIDTSIGNDNSSNIEKYRHYKSNNSSSGLSAGGIAAIIICSLIAVIAVVTLIFLFKTGKFGGKDELTHIENANVVSSNSIGEFKSQE